MREVLSIHIGQAGKCSRPAFPPASPPLPPASDDGRDCCPVVGREVEGREGVLGRGAGALRARDARGMPNGARPMLHARSHTPTLPRSRAGLPTALVRIAWERARVQRGARVCERERAARTNRASERALTLPLSPSPSHTGVQVGNACWELYCLEHG